MTQSHSSSLTVRCEPAGRHLTDAEAVEAVARACPAQACRRKRVLLIVPDGTRSAPIGLIFKALHAPIGGVDPPRARACPATSIPEDLCRKVNLPYRDPNTIRPKDFAGREDQGVLLVPKAGEMLFQLKNPPAWAGGGAAP
jgi:hypothetical protein